MGTKKGTGSSRRRRRRESTKTGGLRKPDGHDRADVAKDTPAEDADSVDLENYAASAHRGGLGDLLAPSRVSGSVAWSDPAVKGWLTYYANKYGETKNPVYVWEALNLTLGEYVLPPDWVFAYLGRVAERFNRLSRANIPHDEVAPAVYRALEFSPARGSNPFRAITDTAHDLHLTFDVLSLVESGHKLDIALDLCAKGHPARCTRQPPCQSVSRSTVMRIFKRHIDRFR